MLAVRHGSPRILHTEMNYSKVQEAQIVLNRLMERNQKLLVELMLDKIIS